MKYEHKQPEEMSNFKVIQEGEGTFKVIDAKEDVSKSSGNDMMVVIYELRNQHDESTLYTQYIVANEYAANNFYKIFEAAGKKADYDKCNGEIKPFNLIGLRGRCTIETESNETFGDKSKIKRFLKYKEEVKEQVVEEDDLPF